MKDKKLVVLCVICALLVVAVIGSLIRCAEYGKKFEQEVENYEILREEVIEELNELNVKNARLEKENEELRQKVDMHEKQYEIAKECLSNAHKEIDRLENNYNVIYPYYQEYFRLLNK